MIKAKMSAQDFSNEVGNTSNGDDLFESYYGLDLFERNSNTHAANKCRAFLMRKSKTDRHTHEKYYTAIITK